MVIDWPTGYNSLDIGYRQPLIEGVALVANGCLYVKGVPKITKFKRNVIVNLLGQTVINWI